MYPWISHTLDFGLQFCEKKCGLYTDVNGMLTMFERTNHQGAIIIHLPHNQNNDPKLRSGQSLWREMVRKPNKHLSKQMGYDLCGKVVDPAHLLLYAHRPCKNYTVTMLLLVSIIIKNTVNVHV